MLSKIEKLISQSELSQGQQIEFTQVLEKASEEELENVYNVLEQDLALAETLYQNYKDKLDAFAGNSQEKWRQILDDEKQLIEKATE